MPYSNIPTANVQQEIEQLTPAAQAYIAQLQKDSEVLSHIFLPDPTHHIMLSQVLGTSFISYLSSEEFQERVNSSERMDVLQHFHYSLHDTMVYCVERFAEQ